MHSGTYNDNNPNTRENNNNNIIMIGYINIMLARTIYAL